MPRTIEMVTTIAALRYYQDNVDRWDRECIVGGVGRPSVDPMSNSAMDALIARMIAFAETRYPPEATTPLEPTPQGPATERSLADRLEAVRRDNIRRYGTEGEILELAALEEWERRQRELLIGAIPPLPRAEHYVATVQENGRVSIAPRPLYEEGPQEPDYEDEEEDDDDG